MTCLRSGGRLFRSCWMPMMTDEEIAALTLPELIELIIRLLEETELRCMESA